MASEKKSRLAERIEKMRQEASQNDGGSKTSPSTSQTTVKTQSRLAQRINNMRSADQSTTVDDDFITVFMSDASSYLRKAKSQYEGIGFSNASDTWNENRKSSTNLLARGQSIRDYLLKNKSSMDGNAYESVMKQVNSINDALRSYSGAFSDARKYYSQWETEDEYNKWKKETEEYEALKNFDTKNGEKEIAHLESILGEYKSLVRNMTGDNAQPRLKHITTVYGGEDDLNSLIAEKKQYLNRAKRTQEGITLAGVINNDDFKENSGYTSTKNDDRWSKLTSDFGMGYDDLTYEYINGEESGMRQEIINKAVSWDADTEKFFAYDHMTEDQISTYNYYYAKDGKEAAEKYLDSIRETLNYQAATERYSKMEGKTALELAFGFEAGVDQFQSGVKNLFNTEDDYIAQTATQMASGMVREDLADDGIKLPDWLGGSSIGQATYDAITTTANMVPSIMTSTVANFIAPGSGAIVGNAMMFASSAGNAYQEALNLGYDKDQARTYSTMVGASEAGLQYLLGGISSLGGSGELLTKMMSGVDNAFARFALKYAGSMASEGLEEGLQEVLTPWFKNLAMHTNESVNWSDVAYSTLLGALTAGVMEGPSSIATEVNTYRSGRKLQDADISAKRLAELGSTFSADTVAYQLAGRVNENTGAYTMGRLFNEIGATLTEQNVTEITNALIGKGMDATTAKKNAKALDYVVEGGQLSDGQIAVIEANEALAEVARTTLIDANTTWNQRSKGYNEVLMALAQEKTSGKNPAQQTQENAPVSDTVDAQNKNGTESLSEAVDTSPAKVQTISSIKNGQVTVKLADGTEVNVKEADLSPDDGVRIETIAKLDNISAADANFILNTLKSNTNASAQVDSLGAREAYKYGYYGFSQEHMTTHGVFSSSLTEAQRQAIYQTGQNARAVQVAAQQATVSKKETVAKNATPTGKVHFEGNRNALTERQSASLTAMEKVADALGVQIYVFESKLSERGKRVGANGWYDPKDSSIHIDLHAGNNGEGTMLFTAAHELTHHIRKWSPEKFKTLSDFLMQEYGKKGVNVDGLVREQIDKAKRTRKYDMSYDEAYEEVVADSMEMMLSDGNVIKRLEKLKAQDKDLWHKIKKFIDDLAAKIRSVYKGLAPDSDEAKLVADMGNAVYRLQELFTEGLVDATENYQASEQMGLEIDAETESVSPAILFSERTWTESDYVQERNKAAKEIAKAIGVSEKKAKAYIDSVNSIAKMIADDRTRLDYFSSPGRSSFVGNVEYGGSFDFSTLCKKRRLLTGTFTAIQKALPNTALTANEILDIRNRMKDAGLEVSCGLCYVEGSRANMGQFAKEFLRLYKQYYPDAWQPNMADVNTPDGIEWVRINHPEAYEQYEYFWNHYGTLKPGDKNLFASQQKPKLYQLHTEYKGEILEKFNDDDNVEEKNLNGGIRLQSFSDFEIVHLIDTMQIIMDMSRVGLAGQAYTKVPDFAWALGNTGLKINLSLIAKGVDADGKLIFDDVEGMPIETAVELRNRYSKNVGTIVVPFNDEQLMAAMADDRVDYIIPFHRSQWKKSQYAAMGLPAKTKDYTYMQNEKFIKPQYHEYRGRMVQDKATNYMPNEYWDFSKSGKENAEAYLEMCARNNKRPKFYKLLQNNGDGSYSLKADGSTDGYWKMLIDFKMYDNDGNGSPQMPVKPDFNMGEATRMLNDYSGGHSNFPVAQGIVDDFVKEYKDGHKGVKYSDRDNTPIFYSQMAKVIDGVKQEKLGAASVVSMLRGKGVKAEEIKWSGIEAWLEGKKSVTKAELQEFIAGSMLQIEEETLDYKERPYTEDQKKRLDEYEAKRNEIVRRVSDEWKRITGEEFPVQNPGYDLESTVARKIIDTNLEYKKASFEGRLLEKLRKDLQKVIENNDDFGYDSWRDALRSVYRHRKDFIKHYEMSTNDKAVIVKFCNALDAQNALPPKISEEDTDRLRTIARETAPWDRKIMEVKHEYNEEAARHMPKWGSSRYNLKGGENYREVLFRNPDSNYTNEAMFTHWDDRSGILAHARLQDFNTFIGKMLFIEELQSDWHNDGRKDGYASEEQTVRGRIGDLSKQWEALLDESMNADASSSYAINEKMDKIYAEMERLDEKVKSGQLAPDAPFSDTYHEYVLKRLIRMAAEEDYDSIGWTPAQIQVDRWSKKFAEGYRIEYDQDIPKFLNKYGKKWGTRVGKTVLDNGTEVWSMAITDSMKESVLNEGQPLYSDRDTESVSNRSLLANAFEGIAKNDIERQKIQEYKDKIDLINSEERKLSELNEKIKELSFSKGPKDTKGIRDLQFEAKQTANRISTYDKQLLRLEASKPLQDVLTREKKMAYQRAEKKGKEALEAYREKAMKTQRELLDRWEESRKRGVDSRQRTAMRHKIKDVVNELNQYLLKGTKDRHVPIELQKAVAEALDAVNMDTVGAEERIAKLQAEMMKAKSPEQIQEISRKIDHIREMGDKMSDKLKKLKDAYDDIINSDDPLIANSHDDGISAHMMTLIVRVGDTPLREMNISQLEDVYDVYRMVLTTIRNANKAFKAKKSESISIIANRVMEEVEKAGGKKKLSRKGTEGIKSFIWNNLKPVYAFEHIGSAAFTDVFNAVRAGEDVWAVDVTEAKEFYRDKSKKHSYDSWDFKKRYTFESTSGMEFSLDLEQIMSLYAYSKRDQAADHLKKGGIVIDETTEITVKNKLGIPVKFNPTEATAYNISDETLANIISKLTGEQKSFVDEMQDYLSTVMGTKGNEVSLEMYGVKLFKEKFYFPLKSAQQFMAKAKEQQKGEVKIKNAGFSKETVQKASNPIVLTPFMNVWADHVNEMSMYHAFVLPMEDFYRVYNYKTPTSETMATESVEMFIQNAYGKGATQYIDQLLKDLNGGARTDSTTGIINKMMGLFKKGAVFASMSVVVQQPSAIARAAALLDTKYFIGPKVDHKRHKALWDEVKQYAPVAVIKEMGYFDTNMGKSTQDFILSKEYSGFTQKMNALFTDSDFRDEALSKAPALADEIAWCGIWEAVKRETKAKNKEMDTKSEAFLKLAGERFTEVIVKTQVYDSVLSRSGLMRSKDTGMKMATAFMAEPTTSINMIADALLQGKRGNRKYARAAIGAVIASQILNSILVSFVYAGRDDDEDETYWEKYIGTLSGEVLDSLNPAGYIPFIKDIMSIVQGYDVERSDMAVISDLWKAWENLGKSNVSTYRKVEGFAGSIAQIFGLPVKNIMRDVRGIYQTIDSFVNGQQTTKAGTKYAVKSALPAWAGGGDVSKQEQLYNAYITGDEAHASRVESRYKDQKAINTAMRSAIKEHYLAGDIDANTALQYMVEYCGDDADEAFWKVEEWKYKSDADEAFSKYNEFYGAVQTGKDLKAVIKKYTDNGVSADTLKTQITSYFKPLYNEMSNAEKAGIKGYLLNAMTVLGDARDKAEEKIEQWEFEDEYGFTYDEKKQQFMEGKISASEMKSIFMEVEGKTDEEANSSIVSYTREAYEEGNFNRSKASEIMVTYGGLTSEEAESKLRYIDVKKQFPDTYVDDAWVDEYYEEVESSGISIEVFVEYRNQVKGITGEGKKERRMAAINSMPISNAQKDALYFAEGWAASKLHEAPWR